MIETYCQNPLCHLHTTVSREKKQGGKVVSYRTRKNKTHFCTLGCQNEWWAIFGDRAIDLIGRITKPYERPVNATNYYQIETPRGVNWSTKPQWVYQNIVLTNNYQLDNNNN